MTTTSWTTTKTRTTTDAAGAVVRNVIGEVCVCKGCGLDVQWHPARYVLVGGVYTADRGAWLDRGGNKECAGSTFAHRPRRDSHGDQ